MALWVASLHPNDEVGQPALRGRAGRLREWARFERTATHRFPYTLVIPAKAGTQLMPVQVGPSSDGFTLSQE
jgi:hypothetical protein